MEGINIKIKLTELAYLKEASKRSKISPYLWGIFFKIDGHGVQITPQFRLDGKGIFHFTKGSHGNLGVANMYEGQVINVPEDIGEWKTSLDPFHIPYFEQKVPSIVGIIAVVMEKNNLSYEGAEAGHQVMNNKVEYAVNQALKEFDPRDVDIADVMLSIRKYFESKLAGLTRSMKSDIANAVKNKQHIIRNILSYFNPDNQIGQHVWNFNMIQIVKSENQTIDFSHTWQTHELGDWKLSGEITIIDDDIAQQDQMEMTEGKVSNQNISTIEVEGRRDISYEL